MEGASSLYRQMVDNVPNPGYTIVATSDGSQCGVTQGIAPGTELSHSVSKSVFGLSIVNNLFSNRSLNVDAFSYALPAYGQQDRLSHVRVYYNYQLLPWWLPSPIHISITVQPIREFTSPPNTLPYENLPGGTANLSESSACANSFTFYGVFINSTQSAVYGNPICFVPSYSALDVETVTQANAAAHYINGTTSSFSPPRVACYIAQQPQSSSTSQYNLTHLAYTARNSEWIFNEMQRPFTTTGNPLSCNAVGCSPVTNNTIAGPLTLCTGSSGPATYTSPIQGPGYTYPWVASPCSAFTVCSGSGPTFQTANVPGTNTAATLTLTVNTGCEFTFSKDITVGMPALIGLQEDLDASDLCAKIMWYNISSATTPCSPTAARARWEASAMAGFG